MIKGVISEYKFKIENAEITIVLDGFGIPPNKNRHTPMHSHKYSEIFACINSDSYIKLSDRIIALRKNECVIIPEGCIHRRIWNGKKQYGCYSIGITCEYLPNNQCADLYSHISLILKNPVILKNNAVLCKTVKNIFVEQNEFNIFILTLELVKNLCLQKASNDEKNVKNEKNIDRLLELDRIVNTKFATDINYEDIADKLCISKRQLARITEKYYGKNLHQIIKIRRMEEALNLLDDSELTIENIALSVGYKSKGNFYNSFKEFYGITPADYRKESKIV